MTRPDPRSQRLEHEPWLAGRPALDPFDEDRDGVLDHEDAVAALDAPTFRLPPNPGPVRWPLVGGHEPWRAGGVAWTELVWAFDDRTEGPGADPARPLVLREDVRYTFPRGVFPDGRRELVVRAGHRSDGPTLGRGGHVAAGLMGIETVRLAPLFWAHDPILDGIADGSYPYTRAVADTAARYVGHSIRTLPPDDAEEVYLGVRLGSLHAEAVAGDRGPVLRVVARHAPAIAHRILRRLL